MGFDISSVGALYSGKGLSAISKRTKVKHDDVAKVLAVGLPALMGGMNRNAAGEEGAASLSRALTEHEAADISNPSEFLAGSDLKDGRKIVGHILGNDQDEVMDEISRASGVSKSKVLTILALAAPLLLSSLGQQNSSASSAGSGGGLLSLLGGLLGMGSAQQSAPQQTLNPQGFSLQPNVLQQGFVQQQPVQQPVQQGYTLQPNVQQQGFTLQPNAQQSASSGMGLLGTLLGGGGASSSMSLLGQLLGGGSSQGQTQFTLAGQQPQQQQEDQSSGLLSGLLNLLH